jgi:glycosyltransferase involved in cell wall biosynthesis
MNLAESILLDNVHTQLINHLEPSQLVFISQAFSKDFSNAIQSARPDLRYVYGDIFEQKNKRFGAIIEWVDIITSSEDVARYRPYLTEKGFLAISTPSQSILQAKKRDSQYRLLSRKSDQVLFDLGLVTIFREPIGKLLYFHRTPHIKQYVARIGRFLPNSKAYSPYILGVYQYSPHASLYSPYISSHTLKRRLGRIRERVVYKIRNHKVNDYIVKIERASIALGRPIKSLLLIHRYNFRKSIAPNIPTVKHEGKRTLVIAMTYLQIGGVERVMLNLVKGIDRDKFTVHILTTVPSHNEWHALFSAYVDTVTHVPDILDNHWPESYRRRYLEEYIARNDTDVLFITNSSTAYHALPKIKQDLPEISVYDLLHTHGTPRDNDAYLRISIPFDKHIDRRIVIDEYLKKYYCSKYPVDSNKISVIYNSLDAKTLNFRFDKRDSEAFFLEIPKNKKVITYVGRLEFDKSPLRLVSIAAELKQRSIPACVVVIGDGSLMDTMVKESKKLSILDEYIYFYGSSNTPLNQIAQSDFTLLVSNSEGVPMSVLESMCVYVPPISSAVGGVPEMISDNKDGLLVTILDTNDEAVRIGRFVDKIETATQLTHKQYIDMTKAARNKVMSKFSSMADKYEHLFETGKVE